ncbi:imidazole glycerol phosphate synthase subunit HisH [Paramaledivibacter caminithermalis]|uniref:Imidazole glycerol phosphate synthase subunit HisH n=1 Tax=Paramaledivibacter caminithermalis (strain DSM 15212 / CIP 107654 / DViRD3) TaxID=1121301 RepID=A0A1M6K9J3_PARC5|nr:imidazole glycerol phosphate synthase subunit HisH [Paramaledivibacter caminithermalis]SHJ55602.1 glutamine amidotransferase [Paramaledivibacter caminithermalis DSM 15212]
MIAIIDYGVGNIKNVYTAFNNLGFDAVITSEKALIDKSSAIILPGVGAFKDAMDNLYKHHLVNCIRENVDKGKLLFGICLGMQLLFEKSHEDGEWNGLGLLEGEIVRFDDSLKVPHMGWNKLIKAKDDEIVKGINNGEYVYFVHSYYLKAKNKDDIVAFSDYGVKVPAIVRRDNIIGMQFHPEKSGKTGMKLLKNIEEMIK